MNILSRIMIDRNYKIIIKNKLISIIIVMQKLERIKKIIKSIRPR
jgi:hypothetical protein